MFRLPLTDRSTQLLRRLEAMALELIDQRGTSRTALAAELGVAGNTLTANLDSDRPAGETTDPRWAFAVFEHFGRDPVRLLAGLCPADRPEELLAVLPVPGLDPAEERRKRRTKAHKQRVECLDAARRLDAWLPQAPAEDLMTKPWLERRFRDPDLEPVYGELEDLEERRHRDAAAVEETCRRALTSPLPDDPTVPEAIRRTGRLGIWGTIQRSKQRLQFARDALSLAISFARQVGDESLIAKQLQRSAYVFKDVGAQTTSVALLREASERYRADRNQDGDAGALIHRAAMAFNQGEIVLAERLYFAGLDLLSSEASYISRSMAAQGIATCRDHRGDVEGALAFLTAAGSEEISENHRFKAFLLHTAANLQRKMMRFVDAERTYWEALSLLEAERDAEAKIKLCLDLAVCLLEDGRIESLGDVAGQAQLLLPHLPNQSFIQKQCELLLRELSSERVSIEAVRRLRAGNWRRERRS